MYYTLYVKIKRIQQIGEDKTMSELERVETGLGEECGVFGIYSPDGADVVSACYHGLYALQHRGQESCGIAVNNDGVISCYKDVGLVTEVFTRDALEKMEEGTMAVGHCRYATTGTKNRSNAQPLLINHLKGAMALCHNGNLTNAAELREQLELNGAIFHATSDTEVIAYTITQQRIKTGSIEEAVRAAMGIIKGAYSLVIMSPTKLIAARDPNGFRPLCMGKIGEDTVFASESCALDAIGDLRAGHRARRGGGGLQGGREELSAGEAGEVFPVRVRVHLFCAARFHH